MRKLLEAKSAQIAGFCLSNGIARLSLFGSSLLDSVAPNDLDLLVEFVPGSTVGYLDLARLELELAAILGVEVDLRTAAELSQYFRDDVVRRAVPIYA